jgi:hypothetical protein
VGWWGEAVVVVGVGGNVMGLDGAPLAVVLSHGRECML